ncbi:MAG TPA: HAD-IA family hydrolase [Armatimonadota bacterium]|jgi:HAD superfamily hydrolase (TIGR01509 family)
MIQAVIFDMDGVLLESDLLMADAIIQTLAECGAVVTLEDFIPYVGAGERRCIEALAAQQGVACDVEATKAKAYAVYAEMARGRLALAPGVREFAARARARGLHLAIASSADPVKIAINLGEIGLPSDTFDVIVSGLDVALKKPHPGIFLTAAERLGVAPDTCLVVEDAVNGIAAARAAGMRCLAVSTTFPPDYLAAADWVAGSLAVAPDACFGW